MTTLAELAELHNKLDDRFTVLEIQSAELLKKCTRTCTSTILLNLTPDKFASLTSYDVFDLDEPALQHLCELHQKHHQELDICFIIKRLATPEMLTTLIRIVFSSHKNYEMVPHLIKLQVDLDSPVDEQGRRPIHLCAADYSDTMMRLLIDYGVTITCSDWLGKFPIHHVKPGCYKNRLWEAKVLYPGDNTLLHVFCNDLMVDHLHHFTNMYTQTLPKRGYEMYKVDPNPINQDGKTPLQILCEHKGDEQVVAKMVDIMLGYGAFISIPIFRAGLGNKEVTKLLVEAMNADKERYTPTELMSVALSDPEPDVYQMVTRISYLVAAGFSVNQATSYRGETGLHIACRQNKFPLVSHLLYLGANSKLLDKNDKLPIEYAIDREKELVDWKIVTILI